MDLGCPKSPGWMDPVLLQRELSSSDCPDHGGSGQIFPLSGSWIPPRWGHFSNSLQRHLKSFIAVPAGFVSQCQTPLSVRGSDPGSAAA